MTSSPCDVKEAVAGVVQPVRRVRRDVAGEGRRERHAGAGAAQRAAAGRAARGRQGLRAWARQPPHRAADTWYGETPDTILMINRVYTFLVDENSTYVYGQTPEHHLNYAK